MSHGSRRDRPPSSTTLPERRHALAAGAPSARLTGSASPCRCTRQVPQPWAPSPRSRGLPLLPVPRQPGRRRRLARTMSPRGRTSAMRARSHVSIRPLRTPTFLRLATGRHPRHLPVRRPVRSTTPWLKGIFSCLFRSGFYVD